MYQIETFDPPQLSVSTHDSASFSNGNMHGNELNEELHLVQERYRTHIFYQGYAVHGHAKPSLINSQKNGFQGKLN